jgi:hypothetical protein
MNQLSRMVAAIAVLALLAGCLTSLGADDKDPTIKEIMTKAHKGGDAILSKLGKDLKADKPDWDADAKLSAELVKLGTALGKNKPPKGEKESWEKLTKAYVETAKALDAAIEKKEKKDAVEDQKKLAGMCKDCHTAHRGK